MAEQPKIINERLSITKTVESGAFLRTVWRKGNKKNQHTIKIEPNMSKVVLGFIGDLELYAYPYDYPDKVFLGKFPVSTVIDSTNVQQILGAYNRTRWFLAGYGFSKPLGSKGANSRRRAVVSSYNHGLNAKRSIEKA